MLLFSLSSLERPEIGFLMEKFQSALRSPLAPPDRGSCSRAPGRQVPLSQVLSPLGDDALLSPPYLLTQQSRNGG